MLKAITKEVKGNLITIISVEDEIPKNPKDEPSIETCIEVKEPVRKRGKKNV